MSQLFGSSIGLPALGIPTIDGLGAVGEGAHAAHEYLLISKIAERTALLIKLLQHLGK